MSCKDERIYSCGDWGSLPLENNSWKNNAIEHHVEHNIDIALGFISVPAIKTLRTFHINFHENYDTTNYYIVASDCYGLASPPCFGTCKETIGHHDGTVSENFITERNTLYYLDMSTSTVFYKHERYILTFNAGVSGVAAFKQKFGTSGHGIFRIKNAKVKCTETFYLILNGVKRVIRTKDYEKDPSWEMSAIAIPGADSGTHMVSSDICNGFDHSIQQILLHPQPPSKAIPMDDEIRCLGFYDYGSEMPGTDNPLVARDGGKDYFYPSWLRSITYDSEYSAARDAKYNIMWLHDTPRSSYKIGMPSLSIDGVPKGNAFYHYKIGSGFCFVGRDVDGQEFVVSELNGADPKNTIISLGVTDYGNDWAYHPISVI